MIIREMKSELISNYKLHDSDTGSVEVQVALITDRVNHLNEHFKMFPKDYASKTGLMKLVGQRRRLLTYLKRQDLGRYTRLIEQLGLRR